MRINRLHLKNFRSHRDSQFNLARVNVIRGHNGAGKSSIQMAIELLLTGKCDVTDQAGRGAQDLITAGASSFEIHALTEKAELQYRRNGNGGQLVVAQQAGKAALAWVEANFAPLPVLSAVLNAHRFLEMDEEEQRALLAGALASEPVDVDPEIVRCGSQITRGWEFDSRVSSSAQVDQYHDWCFKQRTEVNRMIKALGDLKAPEKPEGMPPRDEVTRKLQELRDDCTAKVTERTKLVSTYSSRKSQLEAAQAQKQMYERDLLESDQIATLEKQVKNRTKVAKLDKEIADLQASIRNNRASLADLQKPQADCCPTCGQAMPKQDRSEAIGRYESAIEKDEKLLTEKQAERNKLPDPELAKQKLDAHARAQSPYLRAEQTIKDIGELGDAPDTSALDEEITDLTRRIAAGEEIERQCTVYEGKAAQHEATLKRADTLKAQSAALDRLVEYFSDKGPLKAKLVGGRIPAFRQRMNDVLARFGFECEIELEPFALSVLQLGPDGNGTHAPLRLRQLSESEQYRFGIAFQIALAEATGVGIVVIDRGDMLTPDARGQLTGALLESNLEQAFILATAEPGPAPEIEDVKFIDLANVNGVTMPAALAEESVA